MPADSSSSTGDAVEVVVVVLVVVVVVVVVLDVLWIGVLCSFALTTPRRGRWTRRYLAVASGGQWPPSPPPPLWLAIVSIVIQLPLCYSYSYFYYCCPASSTSLLAQLTCGGVVARMVFVRIKRQLGAKTISPETVHDGDE